MPWQEEGGITNNQGNFVNVNPLNHFIGSRNAGGHLRFHTENGGGNQGDPVDAAEVMRLTDAAQGRRVGIGTQTPQRKLHVEPTEIHSGGGGAGLSFANRQTAGFVEVPGNGERWVWYATGGQARLWSGTDKLAVLPNGNIGIGTAQPSAKLEINNGDLLFKAAAEDPGDIIFQSAGGGQKGRIWSNPVAGAGLYLSSADNNPRLSIDAVGNVRVAGELFLGNIRTSLSGFDGAGFHWIRSNGDEGDMWMAFVNQNAVDPFVKRMVAAVDWYGPRFQEWSDARTKTNIRQVGGPLDKLERIRGVAFEWAESPQALGCTPGRPSIGVIAQEVEAVFPELVSVYDDQGYKAVNYSGLTSVLIEAAKELKAENEALRSRIEALEQAA